MHVPQAGTSYHHHHHMRDERQAPRKSYTASDSSLEEVLGDEADCNGGHGGSVYQKRRPSRRSKFARQKTARSLTNDDGDIALYYQTDDDGTCSPGGYSHTHSQPHMANGGALCLPLSHGTIRHISSETTLFVDSSQAALIRRHSDSSDRSDCSDL